MADGWVIETVPQNHLTPLARAYGMGPVPRHVAVGARDYPSEGPTFESLDEVERFIAHLRLVAAGFFGGDGVSS